MIIALFNLFVYTFLYIIYFLFRFMEMDACSAPLNAFTNPLCMQAQLVRVNANLMHTMQNKPYIYKTRAN